MITDFDIAVSWLGHLLWGVPAVLLLCAWGIARRRQVMETFGIDQTRFSEWLSTCARRRWLRATVLCISFLFLTAAAIQPRCNPEKKRFKKKARDIAVVVDVSRSMLADDLKPNRLERAMLELRRLANQLQGDRVGLVVFAGNVVVKCPLTSNYSYFNSVLKNISTNSASQGGTKIGDAIRQAIERLLMIDPKGLYEENADGQSEDGESEVERAGKTQMEREALSAAKDSYADILLITDGEDHESYPIRAAEETHAADVGLYVVGLGSEEGTPVPVKKEDGTLGYLKYQGRVVKSKLDSKTLMEMINVAPRGSYLPAGVDNFSLVDFYENEICAHEGRQIYEEHVSWTEIFQPFLFVGIFFFALFLLIPERPGKQQAVAPQEGGS